MSMQDTTETTRAVLLAEHDPLVVLDQLPASVFPIRLRVELSRNREHDRDDETYTTPDYPVDIRHPQGPYIPETTIYIGNPARRPPDGTTIWRPQECRDRLQEMLDYLSDETRADVSEFTLLEMDLVEIPPHYLTSDPETKELVPKPELYEQTGTMRIARFEKEGTLTATAVRDRLEDALPGETRTPIQLTRVEEVHAKPSRQGTHTQVSGGRAQYYTETDADQVDDLELTPAIYQLQRLSDAGDRTRPLSPFLTELDDLLPELSETEDLLTTITFAGETHERTVFYAQEVRDR